jgi:hypothetical protein
VFWRILFCLICSLPFCVCHSFWCWLIHWRKVKHTNYIAFYLVVVFCSVFTISKDMGARGIVVGWGTMPQAGRSWLRFPMRSLDFSVDPILQAALWPWSRLSLKQKWVPGIFLGGKGRPVRKAGNLSHLWADCLEKMWEPRRLTTRWSSTVSYRDSCIER